MSNYTYMVTNNINGKVYVGSHSWKCEGVDPDYYGSGTAITRAVKKYGKENFQVEVLYYYETVEECRKDEERILTEYNVRDCPHSYNLKNSAMGGDKGKTFSEEHKQKISQAHKGKTLSDATRKKLSQAMTGENNPMYNKNFSEEHRKKISQAQDYKKTPIVAIDKNSKVKIFKSQRECSRVLGLNYKNVNSCLKGRRKTCKGYTFKYIEELDSGIYEGML